MGPGGFVRRLLPVSYMFLCSLLWVSCASIHQENHLKQGEFRFHGGFDQHKSWKEPLIFKRMSWFSNINLIYEALMTSLDEKSPFFQWVSPANQKLIKRECKKFAVAIMYTDSPLMISHSQFVDNFYHNGYEDFLIPRFARMVKTHPDFARLHLKEGRVMGFCQKQQKGKKDFQIMMPGFPMAKMSI